MKLKLFSSLIIVLLSVASFNAKADVLIDTSSCQVVHVSTMYPNGYMNALDCPAEAEYYLLWFVQWPGSICIPYTSTQAYRVEGNCENYTVYRIE